MARALSRHLRMMAAWPSFAPLWLLFLACVGSSAGSTGGGIKMVRAMLLYKQGLREMVRLIHPNAVLQVKFQDQSVPNNIIYAVLAYLFLYIVSVVAMTGPVTCCIACTFARISAMSCPSHSATSQPNARHFSASGWSAMTSLLRPVACHRL